MPEQTLVQKLQMKPDSLCLIRGTPEGYLAALMPLPTGCQVMTEAPKSGVRFDFVQSFMRSIAELNLQTESIIETLKPGGVLWFCFPKKSGKTKTDLTRDSGWEAVNTLGWGPVRAISIDETWSALRFRPEAEVKRNAGSGSSRHTDT